MKREIVKPKDDSEAGKKKAKKGRSVPAGLALMHGFQATNVGKTRLTVRTLRFWCVLLELTMAYDQDPCVSGCVSEGQGVG